MTERPHLPDFVPHTFAEAMAAWVRAIGVAHVRDDHETRATAGTATFATEQRVWGILRPGSRDEVSECVQIANRFQIPIYPISSGKNWGYGSRVPARDGVILDLARLNRIVDFDEDLAYVTLEPGVTQRQLHDFLTSRGSRLWMDATGASPDCSIVGNTLERGFGHTPMGDHAANCCGLEVVLPSGQVIQTGFGRFPSSQVGAVSRQGIGPSLDGLFAQSNLGVVTEMSVWLMPAPAHFEAFFFMAAGADDLGPIVDALRPLRLDGTLRSAIHIGNDYKVLAGSSQYPWSATGGRTPLDPATMTGIRSSLGIGYWNGSGGLYGTRRQVRDARRRLRQALRGKVKRLHFLNDRRLRILKRFAGMVRAMTGWDVGRTMAVLDPVYLLLKGVPTDAPLASTYWRKKSAVPPNPDPDRDGCGLLWCSPVAPSSGGHVMAVADLARGVLFGHGFEPQMSVSLVTERSAVSVITISYDRDVEGEDARALQCYRDLTEKLMDRGYPPYRLNVGAMDLLPSDAAHDDIVAALRRAVDPRGILAPGRYEPATTNARQSRRDVA